MSSILEALRKSDDKRQKEQASATDRIQFSEQPQKRQSRKGFYLLVLVLLMVAAGLWAHQAGYLSSLTAMFVSEGGGVQNEAKPAEVIEKAQSDVSNAKKQTIEPPKPKQVKQQIVANKEAKAEQKKATEPIVNAEKEVVQTDFKKPEAKTTEPAKEESKSRLIVDGKNASESQQAKRTLSKQESKVKATNKKNQRRQATEKKQQYLLVHQLPFATRQQMPELKVNVHVYDPVPENRMVVINGLGLQIGDDIEGLAQVKDITVEGVVIEAGGTVFLIPK